MKHNNFSWIATWKITRRCNLYCVYCDHATMLKATEKETIDFKKVMNTLHQYAPKVLNISGGEPTLVPQLPSLLAEAKRRWNPYIRVVHNGTAPDKLIPCLPYIDRLVLSIDGPDPVNKMNRGISAASIAAKLGDIMPHIINHHVEVAINCVVTTVNLPYLPELARQLNDLSPSIILSFVPLMPPDDPRSILKSGSLYDDFLSMYNSLKMKGFHVMHVFDPLTRHPDYRHVQCYNQNFVIRVTPQGEVVTCAMNTKLTKGTIAYYFKKLFTSRGMAKAFNRINKITRSSLLHTVDFSCNTLCSCEGWLDMIFLGMESDCIAHYAKALRGRMSETDYLQAEEFVRHYINPEFNVDNLKRIIESPPGENCS